MEQYHKRKGYSLAGTIRMSLRNYKKEGARDGFTCCYSKTECQHGMQAQSSFLLSYQRGSAILFI